jgi:hypothetical protein
LTPIGRLGATVVAVLAMLLGIGNPAHAATSSPADGIASTAGVLNSVNTVGGIQAGGAYGHTGAELLAAGTSGTCTVQRPSSNGALQWDTTGTPAMLAGIVWTGSGSVSCTGPMGGITYEEFAIDPQGVSHLIATGSCAGCLELATTGVAYTCAQGSTIATNCAGPWQVGYQAVITAPAGSTFGTATGGCVATGAVLQCSATTGVGSAPLFAPTSNPCATASTSAYATDATYAADAASSTCYNYPPSGNVQLDLKAIHDIRDTHFPGGIKVDNSKGLFLPTVTNRGLANILDTGLQDTGPWVLNANNYYEKTFPYSGVGTKSAQAGGGPSSSITLVVEKFADKYGLVGVVTMFPANV